MIRSGRLWRLAWVGLLLAAAPGFAQEPEPVQLFLAANDAYQQGDYPEAIRRYRQLVDGGHATGRVHFNLGNAYLRNGELGRAIGEFRRARSLTPRDRDLRANLAYVRASAQDALAPPEPSPVLSTLFFWHYGLGLREIALLTVAVNGLFWGLAILQRLRRGSEVLRWTLLVTAVFLVGSVGSLVVRFTLARPVAVVLPQEISAHTAPDGDSVVRFKLHAGSEIRVKEQRQGWLRVVLPDGQQGWIESSFAEVVADSFW